MVIMEKSKKARLLTLILAASGDEAAKKSGLSPENIIGVEALNYNAMCNYGICNWVIEYYE